MLLPAIDILLCFFWLWFIVMLLILEVCQPRVVFKTHLPWTKWPPFLADYTFRCIVFNENGMTNFHNLIAFSSKYMFLKRVIEIYNIAVISISTMSFLKVISPRHIIMSVIYLPNFAETYWFNHALTKKTLSISMLHLNRKDC